MFRHQDCFDVIWMGEEVGGDMEKLPESNVAVLPGHRAQIHQRSCAAQQW